MDSKQGSNTQRGSSYLKRLAATGGAPVRLDLMGSELKMLNDLVARGYGKSRADALRKALAAAYSAENDKAMN